MYCSWVRVVILTWGLSTVCFRVIVSYDLLKCHAFVNMIHIYCLSLGVHKYLSHKISRFDVSYILHTFLACPLRSPMSIYIDYKENLASIFTRLLSRMAPLPLQGEGVAFPFAFTLGSSRLAVRHVGQACASVCSELWYYVDSLKLIPNTNYC